MGSNAWTWICPKGSCYGAGNPPSCVAPQAGGYIEGAPGATNPCASVGRPADTASKTVTASTLSACMDACRGRKTCSHVAFECGGTCELFDRAVQATELAAGITRKEAVAQCRDAGGLVARLGRTRCAAGGPGCPDGFKRELHGGIEVSKWSCYMENEAAHRSAETAWRTQPVDCEGIFGPVAGMHFQTAENPHHTVPGATDTMQVLERRRHAAENTAQFPIHDMGRYTTDSGDMRFLSFRGNTGSLDDTRVSRGAPPPRDVGQFEASPMAAYGIDEEILVFHHPQTPQTVAARPSPSAKATSCRGEWGTWLPVHWRDGLGRNDRRLGDPGTETPDRAIFQLEASEMAGADPCGVVMTDAGKAAIKPCGEDIGETCRQMNAGGQCFVFIPHKNELATATAGNPGVYLHANLQLGQRDLFTAWSVDEFQPVPLAERLTPTHTTTTHAKPTVVSGSRGYCDCNDGRYYQHYRVARQPSGGGAPCSDPPRRSVERPSAGMTGCDHMCYFQIRNDTTIRHMHGSKSEFVPGCAYENGQGWLHYGSAPCSGTQSHFSWRQGQGGHNDGLWLPNPTKTQAQTDRAFRRDGSASGTYSVAEPNRKQTIVADNTLVFKGFADKSKSGAWRQNVQPRHAVSMRDDQISGGDKLLANAYRVDDTFQIKDITVAGYISDNWNDLRQVAEARWYQGYGTGHRDIQRAGRHLVPGIHPAWQSTLDIKDKSFMMVGDSHDAQNRSIYYMKSNHYEVYDNGPKWGYWPTNGTDGNLDANAIRPNFWGGVRERDGRYDNYVHYPQNTVPGDEARRPCKNAADTDCDKYQSQYGQSCRAGTCNMSDGSCTANINAEWTDVVQPNTYCPPQSQWEQAWENYVPTRGRTATEVGKSL